MEQQKLMGTCPVCDGWVFLTDGGKVTTHKRMDFESSSKVVCEGKGLPPERLQQVIVHVGLNVRQVSLTEKI